MSEVLNNDLYLTRKIVLCPPPHQREVGHIVFGVDTVSFCIGVGVMLSSVHNSSRTGGQIGTTFTWILCHRPLLKSV